MNLDMQCRHCFIVPQYHEHNLEVLMKLRKVVKAVNGILNIYLRTYFRRVARPYNYWGHVSYVNHVVGLLDEQAVMKIDFLQLTNSLLIRRGGECHSSRHAVFVVWAYTG